MTYTLKKTLSIVISLLLIISTFAMADFSAFAKSKDLSNKNEIIILNTLLQFVSVKSTLNLCSSA